MEHSAPFAGLSRIDLPLPIAFRPLLLRVPRDAAPGYRKEVGRVRSFFSLSHQTLLPATNTPVGH